MDEGVQEDSPVGDRHVGRAHIVADFDDPFLAVVGSRLVIQRKERDEPGSRVVSAIMHEYADIHAIGFKRRPRRDGPPLGPRR